MRFVEKCLAGEASADDIDDHVDAWHSGDGGESLAGYLGLTDSEYRFWAEKPGSIGAIIAMRRLADQVDTLMLSPRDTERFVAAIESDAEPNEALKRAAERYRAATGD